VRIAKRVAEETGLAPARVDGLLASGAWWFRRKNATLTMRRGMARDAALLESLANAFDLLVGARSTEGVKLEAILLRQIGDIERLTGEAGALAAQQPLLLRDRMMVQLKELLAPGTNMSEERIAQEIALLAAKADLREELDRLSAHCQEARALIAGKDPAGRKLDFLAQDLTVRRIRCVRNPPTFSSPMWVWR